MTTTKKRIAWMPSYEGDEIALGIGLAIALHAIPIAAIILKAMYPNLNVEEEEPLVAKPVIGATLLKLGKPLDPKKLPDRIVPQARTAPQEKVLASREDPLKKNDKPDAGPPPPNAQESDLTKLIAKSDPFAEDAGKARPEEGFANGSDAGTETDPTKVHAGDVYNAALGKFIGDHWEIPTVISEGEARRLCVTYRVAIDRQMRIWNVRPIAIKASGNELFDDSARTALQKLMDDRAVLPEPPKDVEEGYRGRTVDFPMTHGDASRCR